MGFANSSNSKCGRPGLGRPPGEGNDYPFQYSYSSLDNSMDRRAWWVIVHGVAKRQRQLNEQAHTHTHTHLYYSHVFLVCINMHLKYIVCPTYYQILWNIKEHEIHLTASNSKYFGHNAVAPL